MWIPLQSRANIRCSLIGRDGRIGRKYRKNEKEWQKEHEKKGGKEEAEKNKWKIRREEKDGVERRERRRQTNKKTDKRENQETVIAFRRCCSSGSSKSDSEI